MTRAGERDGSDESTTQRVVEGGEIMNRGPALVTWIASTLRLLAIAVQYPRGEGE